MIYIGTLLIIFFFYIISKNKVNMRIEYVLTYVLLVLIAGLRFRVGGDSLAYENYYSDLPKYNDLLNFDYFNAQYQPSWYFLNALAKFINDSFISFQLLHALLINGIIFWFIKKYANDKWLTLLFYFIFNYLYFNMEILRESLAICVFLMSVPFLIKKNWLVYYLLCFLSLSFHNSALITFVFPFLLLNLKLWQTIAIYFITVIFFIFNPTSLIAENLNLTGIIGIKATTYSSINVTLTGTIVQLIKIIPILIITYTRRKYFSSKHIFDKLLNIYIILGLIASVAGGVYRFQNYLSIISIIYLVDTIILFKKYHSKIYKPKLLIRTMIFIFFVNQMYYYGRSTSKYERNTNFYNRYYPYHSVFNSKKEEKREKLFFNLIDYN